MGRSPRVDLLLGLSGGSVVLLLIGFHGLGLLLFLLLLLLLLLLRELFRGLLRVLLKFAARGVLVGLGDCRGSKSKTEKDEQKAGRNFFHTFSVGTGYGAIVHRNEVELAGVLAAFQAYGYGWILAGFDGKRFARMPTHAMKPHEWGTR
jgi:hypothetical protein